ncbi:hypothetical protein ACVGVM_06250 [Pseudonocardia bannensis]|uniref:Dynamin family protein n=1 Tax=Pseudonocardia bannensis TaxID=630973 RepID=A0A848DCE1_9PSEU|nr:hypothetical protein [Pseudonocardia bannensis]NMH90179.1 hypothetical protein [Pseudonocardia bannensis]
MTGPLCAGLADVIAAGLDSAGSGPTADRLRACLEALAERAPRLAVVGRHSDGVSTVVDTVLGTRRAAVGRVPTASVAGWFRYGDPGVLRAILRNGDARATRWDDSAPLPPDLTGLGLAVREVERIVLRAPIDALRHWTVIDVPGMRPDHGDVPPVLDEADAVLLVLPEPAAGLEPAVASVRRFALAAGLTAVNTVGVLTRPERLAVADADPWPAARQVARAYGERLHGLLVDPVPVAGLLAAAALPGGFGEDHARTVRTLRAADPQRRALALADEWEFRDWADGPVGRQDRLRLVEVIGVYGIRELVAAGADDVAASRAVLWERSGAAALVARVTGPLLAAGDRLRCARLLRVAERAVRAAGPDRARGLAALGGELAAYRNQPELAQVRLAGALTDLLSGRCTLPAADAAALEMLATGVHAADCLGLPADADPGLVAETARKAAAHWSAWESADVSQRLRNHVRAARELAQRLARSAAGPDPHREDDG